MKLEHLNLVVHNIETSLAFYKAAFPHWTIRAKGSGPWNGVQRNWIHFGDEQSYLALNDNGLDKNRVLEGYQIGLAHFAFVVTNLKSVITRLSNAGFTIADEGAKNAFRKNVYYIDPDGFEIEFVEYLSDLPYERNLND